MIAKVQSYALSGLEGTPVTVETDISRGLPSFEMVGLPDAAVKEAKERVRSAVKNSALEFPAHRITVNFAPAYVRKEGSAFDLPVAVSILSAYGVLKADAEEYIFCLLYTSERDDGRARVGDVIEGVRDHRDGRGQKPRRQLPRKQKQIQ